MLPPTNAICSESFKISSLLINPLGRLGLYGTLNMIQETAWSHAEQLGFGLKDMESKNQYWVLTRQHLTMKRWPLLGTTVQVETWVQPPEGAFVSRHFILKEAGEECGRCSTGWLALDRLTQKILPAADLRPWKDICRDESSGLTCEKISANGAFEKLAKYRVRNSDLDGNQHVNNTKYAQWITDAIPYELHKSLQLNGYSVNFLAETRLGDEVTIERNLASPTELNADNGDTIYRGVRSLDGKVLFTASLQWEKL